MLAYRLSLDLRESLVYLKFSLMHKYIATISPPVTPTAPVGVQAFCSVVVWYGPEMAYEDKISGYEVRFYDPNSIHSNMTRYVGANRTFYGIAGEDRLAGENTYVQVPIMSAIAS